MKMNFIFETLAATWHILLESAPYVLFGLAVAGLLKGFVPEAALRKHLSGPGARPVLLAALAGVPLPLCSCGVIPAAMGLRQAGASKGAATAFLVSTPETGVDSMATSYALLDPIMTVVRPLAAFVTAVSAGLLVNRFAPDGKSGPDAPGTPGACGPACGPAGPRFVPLEPLALARPSFPDRLRRSAAFAFGEMLAGIGPWLILGLGLAGVIEALLPADGLSRMLGTGVWPMLAMLALGIPLYVCATASTPIAAALALKGLSPGAALVFLLAGPATNAAGITVVARMFGARATGLYLAAIAVCSLALGLAVDALYLSLGLDTAHWLAAGAGEAPGLASEISAVALLGMIGWHMVGKRLAAQ